MKLNSCTPDPVVRACLHRPVFLFWFPQVWHEAPGDLQRSLYEHFYELLTESSEQKNNMRLMQDLGLVPKLLHILKDETLSHHTVQTLASVISVLLAGGYFAPSLLRWVHQTHRALRLLSICKWMHRMFFAHTTHDLRSGRLKKKSTFADEMFLFLLRQ